MTQPQKLLGNRDWIIGGQWTSGHFDQGSIDKIYRLHLIYRLGKTGFLAHHSRRAAGVWRVATFSTIDRKSHVPDQYRRQGIQSHRLPQR
jgi:hypothetical protein